MNLTYNTLNTINSTILSNYSFLAALEHSTDLNPSQK
jgi:hypothetical protein